jgi:hypothetical protein
MPTHLPFRTQVLAKVFFRENGRRQLKAVGNFKSPSLPCQGLAKKGCAIILDGKAKRILRPLESDEAIFAEEVSGDGSSHYALHRPVGGYER